MSQAACDMFTSRFFIPGLLGSLLAGLFVSASALFIAPAFRRRPQGWLLRLELWMAGPLKIAALSHLYGRNRYVSLDRLRQIVACSNAFGTDIIDILGDVKAGHRFTTRPVLMGCSVAMLGVLTAPLGGYGILGNHDWWQDALPQLRGHGPFKPQIEMEKNAIQVLEKPALRLSLIGRRFWLAGLSTQLALTQRQCISHDVDALETLWRRLQMMGRLFC